jgi:ribonuclease G
MRVLPGMQSAFVDIGLDRDAFLYVTDFFDEEAEFERIVVDKSKKGRCRRRGPRRDEQIEIARVQREQQVESSHERAEPLRELEPGAIVAEEKSDEEPSRRARAGAVVVVDAGRGRASKSAAADVDERSIIPTQAEPIDTPFAFQAARRSSVSAMTKRAR